MNDTTNMVCTYQDFVKAFQKIGYSMKKKSPPCCTFCRVGHTGGDGSFKAGPLFARLER